jgi:phosphoglucosamine mutase
VVEEMRKGNYTLGGESSGHIVFLDRTTTGDGLIASLSVLSVVIDEGKRLSELNKIVQDVPQVLRNIHVGRRAELDTVPGYKKLIDEIDEKLKGKGRTFVRFSGTEPLVRVLVEGPDEKAITDYADQISALLQKSLS